MMDILEVQKINLLSERGCCLLKMSSMLWETPRAEMVIFESAEKIYDWKKKRTLKKWQCNTLWMLVEKYQYRNPEQNTIRVYFLIEKCVVLEDPSKQLNMRRLIGWDNTFRGNHINHITAGIGNSWSDFTLQWTALKKKGTPHNYSQWSYMVHWEFGWNEMSFWIWHIFFEPRAKVNICTAKQKLSAHGSCATNHAWPRKSCLLIRKACTHYSPVSSAGATRLRNVLFTRR